MFRLHITALRSSVSTLHSKYDIILLLGWAGGWGVASALKRFVIPCVFCFFTCLVIFSLSLPLTISLLCVMQAAGRLERLRASRADVEACIAQEEVGPNWVLQTDVCVCCVLTPNVTKGKAHSTYSSSTVVREKYVRVLVLVRVYPV